MKKNAKSTKSTNLNQVLSDLMESKQTSGVITFTNFCRRVPDADKEGCLNFLQSSNKGSFVVGRRGHPSRFVFGAAEEKWKHQELVRADWRKRQGLPERQFHHDLIKSFGRNLPEIQRRERKRRGPGRPKINMGVQRGPGRPSLKEKASGKQDMSLAVTVAGKKTTIPLSLELIQNN